MNRTYSFFRGFWFAGMYGVLVCSAAVLCYDLRGGVVPGVDAFNQ